MTPWTHRLVLSLLLFVSPAASVAAEGRWASVGPFGGTVWKIAVAPGAQRTFYAATSGGIFRSTDAGAHWKPVDAGLPQTNVASLAVDPSDAQTVYAGLYVTQQNMSGVYKTTNGGSRWEAAGLEGLPTYDLAVDPSAPSTVFAATYGGLYRSRDAGGSWEKIDVAISGTSPRIVFDPSAPERLWLASLDGVFVSEDGGDTWTSGNQSRPGLAVGAFAVSRSGVLYALQETNKTIWRSADHGATWKRAGRIPEEFTVHALEVSPDETALYAGGDQGFYRSTDRGNTWIRRAPVQRRDSVLSLAVTSDAVYSGLLYRGIAKSADRGFTWKLANQGLSALSVLSAAIAPSDPRVLYVSAEGPMVLRTENGGLTWKEGSGGKNFPRLLKLSVDPRDARQVEGVGDFGQFWRSADGGDTWEGGGVPAAGCVFPTSLTRSQAEPSLLLWTGVQTSACQHGHEDTCHNFESTNGGARWRCLREVRDESFRTLVADPRHPDIYYGAGGSGVMKSTDGGDTWTPTGFTNDAIAFAASPRGDLWAGWGGGLFRSNDGGATWTQVTAGLLPLTGIWRIAIAPSAPSVLYAEGALFDQDAGYFFDLYVSTDGGATWRLLSAAGLPPAGYFGYDPLLVDPKNPGRVYVGTAGGLYRLDGANR
ncbi:MAG TPA: YCF48-related protein [Thermoanaerobaculia bacterium]|nr:YCF48-related protein [Thermoanaerobaculia bacterium]